MYDKYERNLAYLGICDPPFVLPTEAEVSLPVISVFPLFSRNNKAGKVIYEKAFLF